MHNRKARDRKPRLRLPIRHVLDSIAYRKGGKFLYLGGIEHPDHGLIGLCRCIVSYLSQFALAAKRGKKARPSLGPIGTVSHFWAIRGWWELERNGAVRYVLKRLS